MDEKTEISKLLFEDIDKYIADLYNNVEYSVEYKELNYQIYMSVSCEKKLTNKELLDISRLFSNKYHLEFLNEENKQIINTHFLSVI